MPIATVTDADARAMYVAVSSWMTHSTMNRACGSSAKKEINSERVALNVAKVETD